jgi:hypothetical protein
MTNNSEKAELWVGEGAMAYNSGRQGVTDSFLGSLWFANHLGALPKTKPVAHRVYCRQALIGGFYELISHENLNPNPDFWMAYLWKKIVGSKAIGPIQSPTRKDSLKDSSLFTFGCCEKPGRDSVLIHSFCATSNGDGDVVFVVINISESKAINLNVTMGKNRTEYLLSPNKEGFQSREVLLNGKLMSIENGTLPQIHGILRKRNEEAYIPPTSIVFLVVHGSQVKQCLESVTSNLNHTADVLLLSSKETLNSSPIQITSMKTAPTTNITHDVSSEKTMNPNSYAISHGETIVSGEDFTRIEMQFPAALALVVTLVFFIKMNLKMRERH